MREVDPSGVRSYWTPARMRAAEPLTAPVAAAASAGSGSSPTEGSPTVVEATEAGSAAVPTLEAGSLGAAPTARAAQVNRDEISDPAAEPFRPHGKIFLTISGGEFAGDYVCSGTAIASGNRSVVWSAGHCVFDTDGGGYASNWMFAPGYKNGATPFGEWTADELASPKEWRQNANLSYDLGAAVVGDNFRGQSLTEVVGGRGIAFNQPRSQSYEAFGYPAQQPPLEFTGGREFRCTSPLGGSDNPEGSGPNTMIISCDMTGGSSGGGWVAGDTLLSVSSYSLCIAGALCDGRLYGPYMDGTAEQLYKSVAGEAEFCGGLEVTLLGTSGPDELTGTSGDDVIKSLGGADRIEGEGGSDTVCAGGGGDEVKGGDGKDDLRGGGGKDEIRGGHGKDVIKGQDAKDLLLGQDGKDTLKGGDADDKLKGQGGPDVLKGKKGKDTCNGGKGKDEAFGCEKESKIP